MPLRLFPVLLSAAAGGLLLLEAPASRAQVEAPDAKSTGVEVEARGPVHEAYAEPTTATPTPGPVVPKEPPAPIEEQPPEEKPAGDNVVWIPGYWSWDDEASNFLWVSGFWRAVPPGRTWVPGHWQQAEGGWQWVAGYWAVAGQEESEYLPEPPAPAEAGPSTPAPGADYTYVPGLWIYQVNRYVWRPGYWLAFRPGWVWVPACYRWTPVGYLYVPGYWDVPLLERGLLFAPVRFVTAVYRRPGFIYQPAYCIQPDFLCGALFVRAGLPCYYFGDYFAARYRRAFVPWFEHRFARGAALDVNFVYYRHAYRDHPRWERGLQQLYAGRYSGTITPPPRTLVQQQTVVNNITVNNTANHVVNTNVSITNLQNVTALAPVTKVNKLNVTALASLAGAAPGGVKAAPVGRPIRVEKMTEARVKEARNAAVHFTTLARERRQTEANLAAKAPKKLTAPLRAKLELPKGTPPSPVLKSTPAPTPPHPKAERPPVRPEGKPVTPGTRPPVTAPPPPKGATPPPKEKAPPPKEKSPPPKEATPPPKGKAPPPKGKEKDKDKETAPPKGGTPPPLKAMAPPAKGELHPPREVAPPKGPPPHKAAPPPPPKPTAPPPPPSKGSPPPPKDKKPDRPEKKDGKGAI